MSSVPELERRLEQVELALAEHLSLRQTTHNSMVWAGTGARLVRSVRARFPRRPTWLS